MSIYEVESLKSKVVSLGTFRLWTFDFRLGAWTLFLALPLYYRRLPND